MTERQSAQIFGKKDNEGRVTLNVSGSRDISEFVRGGRPIAEFSGMTTEDGLRIDYTGTGNFRLSSSDPAVISRFLRGKSFNIGSRKFRPGSSIRLP